MSEQIKLRTFSLNIKKKDSKKKKNKESKTITRTKIRNNIKYESATYKDHYSTSESSTD